MCRKQVLYQCSPSSVAVLPSQRDAAGAWDPWSALMDLGNSVSDGITGIADNISDFVSDLASAFDAGWDDNQEHGLGCVGCAWMQQCSITVAGAAMLLQRPD